MITEDTPEVEGLADTPATPEQQGGTTDAIDEESATEEVEDGSEEESEERFEDVEFEGKNYRVPSAIKSGLMRTLDYTQSKQQLSADRKTLEAAQTALEERSKVTDEELDAKADLRTVTRQLAEYAKATPQDWTAFEQQDPVGAQQSWRYYQLLKDQKAELEGKIGEAEKARTDTATQDMSKRIQETLAYAAKNNIPRERLDTVVKFAAEKGVPEAMVRSYWGPLMLDILNLAQIGQEVVAKRASKPPSPAPAKPMEPIRPKGKAPRPGLNDDLPIEEWRKKFSKQYFG